MVLLTYFQHIFNSFSFVFCSGEEYGEEEQFDDDEEIEGKPNESKKFYQYLITFFLPFTEEAEDDK